jgi:8-oxo-dGTP pyrophosphatase MutT (NUDIX family)
MCEVIRHDASKWAAILHLADLWGVAASEICAVGDDMNDLPMISGAGLGVAMGHAPEPVRAAADLVTGDHDQDGVSLLVHDVLLTPRAEPTALSPRAANPDHAMSDPMPEPATPHAAPSWARVDGDGAETSIEENWLFRLRRERFRSRRTGRAHDYYVMHLADAVNVIALTDDDQVVLVRQFRAGSGRDSLEPPGGLLEPEEDPCEAGARELLEETGYAGDHAVFLGAAWSNPSIMTSKIAVIVVKNARRVAEPKLDAGEEVSVELAPARSIPRMIREGRIDHALSVMSLLWWLHAT